METYNIYGMTYVPPYIDSAAVEATRRGSLRLAPTTIRLDNTVLIWQWKLEVPCKYQVVWRSHTRARRFDGGWYALL